MKFSNWETPEWHGDFPEGTSKPIAVFNVEIDGRHIKNMNLCRKGDEFEVRCNGENRVELTADDKDGILQEAVAEYTRRGG